MKTVQMLEILVLTLALMPCPAASGISGSGTANHIPKFIDHNTLGDSAIYEASGKVSIGTTSPEKGYRLTVDGEGSLFGIYVRNTGDIGIQSIGTNYGLKASGNSRAIWGRSTRGIGVYGESKKGYAGYFVGGRNYFEGNVGIGTTNPGTALDVDGMVKATSLNIEGTSQYTVRVISNASGAAPFYAGYFRSKAGGGATGSVGVWGEASGASDKNVGGRFAASGGTENFAIWSNNGKNYFADNVGIGTDAPAEKLTVRGGNLLIERVDGTDVVEIGEGLDYAEGFDVSDEGKISAGSVLSIDADNPGKLALSNKPYDSKVAGIVAGAKGQGSGVRLGAGQFDYDVALAGRVYCNVDATEIAVQPGDLLTTSATEGYAMKATDYIRAQGAILGKAMEKLEKGKKGQIMVLVTLQ